MIIALMHLLPATMQPGRPKNLIDEHFKTGLIRRLVLEHGFLFVNRHQWQRLPSYKQLLIIGEVLAQCEDQNPGMEIAVRVIDDNTGMRLAG